MTGLRNISRLRRKAPALALVPAVAFSVNLLCSGLCGLDAHGLSGPGHAASSSLSTPLPSSRAETAGSPCPHHAPRGEKQDSTPRPSPAHDDGTCPGCNWAAEPSLNGMLQLAVPHVGADWSLPFALLEPLDPPAVHAVDDTGPRVWPPDGPLFLRLNVLRI